MGVNHGGASRDPRHNPALPSARRRTQAERSASTRDALVAAARELFAARGYVDTPREEICHLAGVTRGALDHHFAGKRGLFRAVVEDVEHRLGVRIAEAAMRHADPVAQLRAGCHEFVDAATDPEVRRIVLLDARAVLGWADWQEIESGHGLGLTMEGLQAVMDAGRAERRPVEPLARMLLAALTEAAMYVATATDPDAAGPVAHGEVDRLVDGLLG
jgi:AcrR family transcriptional regulator